MSDQAPILGLCIRRQWETFSRNAQVCVDVCQYDGDKPAVHGIGTTDFGHGGYKRGRLLDGLVMQGHVYEGSPEKEGEPRPRLFIAYDPRYLRPYSVELADAERMVKALKAWEQVVTRRRRLSGKHEITHVEMLVLFAKFAGATYVAWRDDTAKLSEQGDWKYMTVAEGVALYGREIDRLRTEWIDPWARQSA